MASGTSGSRSAAVCALSAMAPLKRKTLFSEAVVPAADGCAHNAAQLCAAAGVVIRLIKRNYERNY